ncbi:MAG TPA: LacI family DNA-binding transcriptional regulator [Streptosporangiaceae bacterium]|nr:LacI family DNA-binding transcriptional regulator [Streptosporangiaceae bacterium]
MDSETGSRQPRRPTIRDVARVAGVSPTTVSNALNGRTGRLSAATAERLRRACDELGFVPDELGRQLRRGHAKMIGLIVPSVANPFWGEFVRAAEDAARPSDFTVLSVSSDRLQERERAYTDSMYRLGIRAVLFGTSPLSLDYLSTWSGQGLHIVVFDRRFRRGDLPGIDCVTADNRRGGYLATKALLDLGHRRIGFLSGPIKTASRRDRFTGYRRALTEAGIDFDPGRVWAGSGKSAFGDPEGGDLGRAGALELLGKDPSLTAMVAINDMYAIGAYAGIRSTGRSVPTDVSVTGFDDIVLSRLLEPALSTVRQPIWEMARVAVDRLIARIEGAAAPEPLREQWSPELIIRGSVAPPPSPAGTAAGVRKSARNDEETRPE